MIVKIKILLSLLCLGNFSQAQKSMSVIFDIELNNTKEIEIETLRFYVSNFEIIYTDAKKNTIDRTCHLVDMKEKKSQRISIPTTPNKTIKSIHYLIGTDSLTNVSGALDGDLDPIKGMYWAWNSGYINFKLEGTRLVSGKASPFEYHIWGYNGKQATARKHTLDIPDSQRNSIIIKVNPFAFIEAAESINEFSIMIPGKKAVQLARFLPRIFTF